MANSDFKNASIRCTFDHGLDENGKVKKKVKMYHNVTDVAAADAIYEAARVLTDFGTKPLIYLEKQSNLNIYA